MPDPGPVIPASSIDYQDGQRPRPGRIDRFGMLLLRWLKTGDPAKTIDRLFVSKHVEDLRFIVGMALLLLCVCALPLLVYASEIALSPDFAGETALSLGQHAPTQGYEFLKAAAAFVGLLATGVAVVGAICAWAHKIGSARLGVVDLFACEISTLCRVTLVTDTVGRFIARIEQAGNAKTGCAPRAVQRSIHEAHCE